MVEMAANQTEIVFVNRGAETLFGYDPEEIVGKPIAFLLMGLGATVTVCHTRTRDMAEHTRRAAVAIERDESLADAGHRDASDAPRLGDPADRLGYSTGGGEQQLALIEQLGATAINYKTDSVEQYVAEHTGGAGFDVVFDSVGGDNLNPSLEAARINGDKDRDLKAITSEAYRQSQEIKGRADAEAADIYAAAYNRDPDFYRFLKTMEVYHTTLDKDTILLLSTDGEFLRYLERDR